MVTEGMRKARHERIFKEIFDNYSIEKEILIARACLWWGCSRRTALEYIQVVTLADKRVKEFKDTKKQVCLKVEELNNEKEIEKDFQIAGLF